MFSQSFEQKRRRTTAHNRGGGGGVIRHKSKLIYPTQIPGFIVGDLCFILLQRCVGFQQTPQGKPNTTQSFARVKKWQRLQLESPPLQLPCKDTCNSHSMALQVSTAILMMRNAYIFHPATAPEAGTPSSWAFQRPLKRRRRRDDTYLLEKPLDSFARSLLGTPAIVADGGGGGEGARPWAFTKTTERVNEYHVLYICMHVCLCM